MKTHIQIKYLKIYGAPVYIHKINLAIIAILLIFTLNDPISGPITLCSYLSIILLHEYGHAFFINKLGYKTHAIYLGVIHGLCEYELPYIMKHQAIIAWGGVLAQLFVAIPLIIISQTTDISRIQGVSQIVAFLGYISALVSVVNLAPARGLDGATAWKIFPILIKEKLNKKPKRKKHKFKVIK